MTSLPPPLGDVRQEAIASLEAALGAMCDGADDHLFDLSQKASADEQSLYFDAMRELRLQRAAVTSRFLEGAAADFDALVPGAAGAGGALSLSLDELTLVDDDAMDVSVAVQGMVSKAAGTLAKDLDHLAQRFAKVLGVDRENLKLPLHPEQIGRHFRAAIDPINLPVRARLILLKLFERKVFDALQDIVAAANQTLARAGILPEIVSAKPRPIQSASRASSRDGAPSAGETGAAEAGGGGDAGAGVLQELLALARGLSGLGGIAGLGGGGMVLPPGMTAIPIAQLPAGQIPVMVNGQPMVGGVPVQSDVPLQVMAPVELAAMLTRLQQLQLPPPAPEGRVLEHVEAVDVKGELSELLQEGAEAPRALNAGDDDLITLLSMLFDFILEDRELQPEIRALVGRLQIPLLKVALLDKGFFGSEDHPARRLLNELARAGVGWTRESDDGLYARMEEVVSAVINEFTDNVALFARLEAGFSAFLAEREKRLAVMEARLRDREEGQAKADLAQQRVRQEIATRLAGKSLPAEALAVVNEGWHRVLNLTALREGPDSEAWTQRLKVLDVLVFCSRPPAGDEAREKQRSLAPRLLVSLRKGMVAEGLDAAQTEPLLTALAGCMNRLQAGEQAALVRVVADRAPPAGAATTAAPTSGAVLRQVEGEAHIQLPAAPSAEVLPQVDPRWLETADRLSPGMWIEFADAEHAVTVRGKIAARVRTQNKYVFVNARGFKVMEKTVAQVAEDLQSGKARLLGETALFDRALEGMIAQLKATPAGAA